MLSHEAHYGIRRQVHALNDDALPPGLEPAGLNTCSLTYLLSHGQLLVATLGSTAAGCRNA